MHQFNTSLSGGDLTTIAPTKTSGITRDLSSFSGPSLVGLLSANPPSNEQDPSDDFSPIPVGSSSPSIDGTPSVNHENQNDSTNSPICTSSSTVTNNTQDEENDDEGEIVKPKRPLNAYNLFFRHERARLLISAENGETPTLRHNSANKGGDNLTLRRENIRHLLANNPYQTERKRRPHRKSHGKVGFSDLARHIAETWKATGKETRELFAELAQEDKERHRKELEIYKRRKMKRAAAAAAKAKMMTQNTYASDPLISGTIMQPSPNIEQHHEILNSQPGQQHTADVLEDRSMNSKLLEILGGVLDSVGSDVVSANHQMNNSQMMYPSSSIDWRGTGSSTSSSSILMPPLPQHSWLPKQQQHTAVEADVVLSSISNCNIPQSVPGQFNNINGTSSQLSSQGLPQPRENKGDLTNFLSQLDWSRLDEREEAQIDLLTLP